MPELLRRSGAGRNTAFGHCNSAWGNIINSTDVTVLILHGCARRQLFEHLLVTPYLAWVAPVWHAPMHWLQALLISFITCYAGGRHLLQSPAPTSQDVQNQVNQVP